jgi:hypothetical protein
VNKEARHKGADAKPHHRGHPDAQGCVVRSPLIDEVARERCGWTEECAHREPVHEASGDKPMDTIREDESEIA